MSRLIGTVDVDDHVNTWFNHAIESWSRRNTYEQQVLNGGALIRTRKDQVAVIITMEGIYVETSSKTWYPYADALLAVDQERVDLSDGIVYAACDVIDVVPVSLGVCGQVGGLKLRAYRYSVRIQTYSGNRL